ncbi:MAG: 4-hydroxybenzoyl-CoA reductase subunit gamma [Acidimicrobiaceae bacterium]|jgi:carbon-monoxide dehydrogenase small subunit|nr:4-hydroxybenzoyl-CoA reductase subunit gamma [Acidimicrobiaceae bacterium]HAY52325.1 4-hydroxybenzoyl-CoA reductase subunit gamma [Acidimicrobiaceae bacterium]|tara:strand:- start:1669 stop:2154 length:486 start_codon:yes stop_codon:yes gene_type:complete
MKVNLRTQINDREIDLEIEPRLLLSDLLREHLNFTGTHVGCSYGVCGACTVIIDGKPARSCLTLAIQANNCSVRTIEGIAASSTFDRVSSAFHQEHGLQCGFCTPGIICSIVALTESGKNIAEEDIDKVVDGHLCRCTGYVNIRKAAKKAVGIYQGDENAR